ncbi:GyrI-like domain-containing protein [Micromonospora aurantiaca]|uniref:AraC family transcriptional regulator n=1 Tax=Micromonospora aurantiaca (nom. illeg.) TaxID=47850 RepID=UPI000F3F3ADE|nr:AraC family transcriptional regulator [Micromonospora aurantiaca]RNI00217.1 AraC family transcriptional regulator [Micromonospora aurantiaca]
MLDRLNAALDHLEQRLDQPLDVAALARIAGVSEHHFGRLFSALAGLPLSEYVRRRRMTLAGADVLAGRESLLAVAVRWGYGSNEAFARAFRAVHGVGPTQARQAGAVLRSQPRMSFRLVVEGNTSMDYRIVTKDAFRLAGLTARVPLVHEGMNPHIVAFVRGIDPATVRRIEALSDQEPRGIVNVSAELAGSRDEGTELDYWYAAVTGADVPDDLRSLPVEAGDWAVFSSSGAFPVAVQHLWRAVFTSWFPSNPYETRPGPEISRVRVAEDGGTADAELWIPVRRV